MSAAIKKPFCKVCKDAGKPESEYTNHWVKDFNGKTTCPTLLNTECRYCFKKGHTIKFCEVLVKKNKEKERAVRKMNVLIKEETKPTNQKKQNNAFAALCEDSDDEEEEEVSKTNNFDKEFPLLSKKNEEKNQVKIVTGWATIASKPKPIDVPRETNFVVLTEQKEQKEQKSKPAPWAIDVGVNRKAPLNKSWADLSDSDDDDDDDVQANDCYEFELDDYENERSIDDKPDDFYEFDVEDFEDERGMDFDDQFDDDLPEPEPSEYARYEDW